MTSAALFGIDAALVRRRGALVAVCAVVGGAAVVVALSAAGYAGVLFLAQRMPVEQALLIVAAAAAALAICAALCTWLALRSARREIARAIRSSAVVALGPPALSVAMRHTRLAGVAAALGAGFWLARRGV